MKLLHAGGTVAASVVVAPLLAVLAVFGAGATSCPGGGTLAPDAEVPDRARPWIATAHRACPALPEPWLAAVMAQESGFDPDAYAGDANGGTWGLFQLNATVWRQAYGGPWSSDRNGNGIADVRDPDIHARVAGTYLCRRLDGVRAIRAQPQGRSGRELTELQALVVAHNAGESRLASYPSIPEITARFLRDVDARAQAWSGCAARLVAASRSGREPAEAIRVVLSMAGTRSGWYQLCDRLVCRAYGYATSGYLTAATHWAAMVEGATARPGDRCPPAGAFVFWAPAPGSDGAGHVALVTATDPWCDPRRIELVSNDVGDAATGNRGGVYRVSLAGIEAGFMDRDRYLGWSLPICAGSPVTDTGPAV